MIIQLNHNSFIQSCVVSLRVFINAHGNTIYTNTSIQQNLVSPHSHRPITPPTKQQTNNKLNKNNSQTTIHTPFMDNTVQTPFSTLVVSPTTLISASKPPIKQQTKQQNHTNN